MHHRIEETINRNICIGCGVCSVATGGAIPIKLGMSGIYQADLHNVSESDRRRGSRVCPFSDESPNEVSLGAPQQPTSALHDPYLGQFLSTFAGRVMDPKFLMGSSSGGLTSWLIDQLLAGGYADAVIKVGRPGPSEGELFGYELVDAEHSLASRKSQYYAATLAEAVSQIENDNRRFILVGVPCFIRAARALCRERPEYSTKLVFFIGLVCGHYKTQAFAESMAWQVGVHPDDLEDVDFRIKNDERPSSDYDFGAKSSESGEWSVARTSELIGGKWGYNAFQPEACNFCDDVVGETADVSFGDAWLPQFTADHRGTNIVISRNVIVDELLQQGAREGSIYLESLPVEDAIGSQAGGFRHRREGLSVRLADDIQAGLSVPTKRVSPSLSVVPLRRRVLIRQRRHMAARSQKLFAEARIKDNLNIYLKGMKYEILKYQFVDASSLRKLAHRLKQRIKRISLR